jgi:hypothetical protein
MIATPAIADLNLDSIGLSYADSVKKFNNMDVLALRASLRHSEERSHFLLPDSWDLTLGLIDRNGDGAVLAAFGPTLRFGTNKTIGSRWFVDTGVHLTFLSDSNFDGKEMGGNVFFTSHIGIGAYLGGDRRSSLILDYRHTSNAGLDASNPGVDMVNLSFNYHFDPGGR